MRRLCSLALAGILLALAPAFAAPVSAAAGTTRAAGAAAAPVVTEYPAPEVWGLTPGPGGDVWYRSCQAGSVGHTSPAGATSAMNASAGGGCSFITTGPDGNLWYGVDGGIERMTPQGVISDFPFPSQPGTVAKGITGGPDGNLWFSDGDQIGRMAPDGSNPAGFPLTAGSFAFGITPGPDGNLWFSERTGNRIGRITPAGVVTEFGGLTPYPSTCEVNWPGGPTGITLGGDGNLWFSEVCNGLIGRITPQGAVTEFAVPTLDSKPWAITTGPDGNVWFTENKALKIGRVTPSGGFAEFAVPGPATTPSACSQPSYPFLLGITAGADGRLWFGTCFGVIGALAPPPAQAQPYNPLVPARVLDTRTGLGGATLGGGQSINVAITGRGGVPANATGVVLNVTVTGPSLGGYLTIWPAGGARPLASSLNFSAAQTIPNLVQVALGTGGGVSIFNSAGSTDVIADVQGYTGPAAGAGAGLFTPVTPARLLDTRAGGTLGPGGRTDLAVAGAGGVPATGVSAVVLNVTVTNPSASGYVTIWPAGANRPLASNLNFTPGLTIPNRVEVQVGSGGKVSILNFAGSADVIVDVNGWYSDGSSTSQTVGKFTGVTPTRLLDTRQSGSLGPGGVQNLNVTGGAAGLPATGVTAVVLNVTVTNPSASGYLTVWPAGTARPTASDLNFDPGQTIPNLVVVGVSAAGQISIFNFAGSSDVIVDIAGWYS